MNRAVDMLNDEDYVWFMNAGDLFGSSESINEVLVVLRRDEPVWAYGSFAIIEEDGTLRGVPRQEPYSLLNHAYGQTPICHQAVITRVAELRHVGTFDLRFKIAADWKALLSLSVLFDPAVINSTIARYRAGGISDRTILKNIREQRQIRRAVLGGSTKTLVRDNSYDLKRVLRFLAGRLLTLLVKAHLVQPDWRARRDM
jgi:hypothetical protein